ncbi:hypothetical protein PC9H_010183 [Pleurotus ostreatus]|uniref:Uncharacterized protein n=1 Tax=Pleurotus ostreatus TaxID=5322 RepID=A0A8H7DQA9_PLEOS|nr:uncharacterized protein PC9H_010183 [Pleurotus ostreatus]KAF7424872.1 hypothetical protein PC9H_010183 [Pleurotus ostreatus]
MADNASSNPLSPVACRFIPFDQWLVTHVDQGWTIKDVKGWLLGKCIPSLAGSTSRPSTPMMSSRHPRPRPSSPIVFAPDPNHRPMSPITFAQPLDPHPKGELSDDEDDPKAAEGTEGMDREWLSEGDIPSGGRIGGKTLPAPQTGSLRSDGARSSPHPAFHRPSPSYSSAHADPRDSSNSASQYTLIRFSTGQILEDDFTISMYDIRPYELLEIHRANVIVNLPRHILRDYIRPYWEGPIKVLRVVWRDDPGPTKHEDRHYRDDLPRVRGQRERKTKTALEWRDRWIVIKAGVLLVFKDPKAIEPAQELELVSLMSINNADHLKNLVPTSHENRVICVKFRMPPKVPPPAEPSKRPESATTPTTSTTVTTITAGSQSKATGRKKLHLRSSFPSSSNLKGSSKPSSSKGLTESSSKSNLNNMFTMSSWKLDKKKQKKDVKGKGRADPEPEDGDKDKSKAGPSSGSAESTVVSHNLHNPPPSRGDARQEDGDHETVLSSPVFARTSGSEEESDESEYGRRGPWRSKGGYGYKVGYRYVSEGHGRGNDGEAAGNASGDGTGPGTGAESGTGEEDKEAWNETTTTESLTDARSADLRSIETRTTDLRTMDSSISFKPSPSVVSSARSQSATVPTSSRRVGTGGGRGEWIVMDAVNDDAFNSLLRIFHRLAPDPIESTFVPGLSSLTSASSSPLPSPTVASRVYAHHPDSPASSQISLIGSTTFSHTAASSRGKSFRRDSQYSIATNTFGALPYPEWRVDIAVKAQKAGMGDVGRAMGWMLWGRTLTDENDSMKAEMHSTRSSGKSKGSGSKQRKGKASSRKSVKSTHSTLTPTPSVREPADPYASDVSGGVSSDESDFGLHESDESDGYNSEAEWQGWMADLHRQAQVRRLHRENQRYLAMHNRSDTTLNLPLVSGGWHQSPYRNSVNSNEIPQTQAQALRLYQEGRRALEPTAVVVSLAPPLVPATPNLNPITPQAQHQSNPQPPPHPSLSSPSSSESLPNNSQRHRSMSFSPVDQPSSATPISAYPLEPDKISMIGTGQTTATPFVLGSPNAGPSFTPTPKTTTISERFIAHMTSVPFRVKTPPQSGSSSSHPPSPDSHSKSQRRASTAGLMTPSQRACPSNGEPGSPPESPPNKGSLRGTGSMLSPPTSGGKGHRPRLSVTTTANANLSSNPNSSAAQQFAAAGMSGGSGGGSSGSPPAQPSSPPPHPVQSPTKSRAGTFLHRMRSGSSMRSEDKRHES